MKTLNTLALAGLLAMAAGTPALAAELQHATSRVSYDDLNLNRDADVRTLYERLQRASRQVCVQMWGHELAHANRRHACRREVLSRAMQDVDHPRLYAASK